VGAIVFYPIYPMNKAYEGSSDDKLSNCSGF
jgi:hypothetical protein